MTAVSGNCDLLSDPPTDFRLREATAIHLSPTNDQHEGMNLADRLGVMNKGTIEQVGTPEEIIRLPVAGRSGRDGTIVQAGLRPELLSLARRGHRQISGHIGFVEQRGSARLAHVLVEDVALSIRTPNQLAAAPGDEVGITIPPRGQSDL